MSDRAPVRIQRRRTRGWRMPEGAVYVGRPTKWGNPFPLDRYKPGAHLPSGEIDDDPPTNKDWKRMAARWAMQDYREWCLEEVKAGRLSLDELRSRDLACWCAVGEPCHADVLLELANSPSGRMQAPWTPAEVEALNEYQRRGEMHPFTCANGCGVLEATESGWRCPCGYTQAWAWTWMVKPLGPLWAEILGDPR